MANELGFKSQHESDSFVFSTAFRPSYTKVKGECFPGAKQMWHESDHLPSASAVVKNKWICISSMSLYCSA
jgi:hypothetical protein